MILIIEDTEDIRTLLLALLGDEGYACVGAANATAAAEVVAATVPSLMIIDRGLPDLDGLTLLRQFRSDVRLADVPAIVFSAFGDACKLEALAAGANLFFKKGRTESDELLRAVRQLAGPPTGEERAVTGLNPLPPSAS
jgi:CheY-like chemotaxis protein